MKNLLLTVTATLALWFSGKETENVAAAPSSAQLQFDTFRVVGRLWLNKKAAAADTIVLVAQRHNPFGPPPKAADWRYEFEPVRYHPFDTVQSKAASPDTVIWVSKPYRP